MIKANTSARFHFPRIGPFSSQHAFSIKKREEFAAGKLIKGIVGPQDHNLIITEAFIKNILDCGSETIQFEKIRVLRKRLQNSPYTYVKTAEKVGEERFFSIDQVLAMLYYILFVPNPKQYLDISSEEGMVRNVFFVKGIKKNYAVSIEMSEHRDGYLIECLDLEMTVTGVKGGITVFCTN